MGEGSDTGTKTLVAIEVVVCLLAAVLVIVPPAGALSPGASARSIAWGPCSDPSLRQARAQCGYLAVPLDYSDPHGPTIQLAVSRVRHTSPDARYQGIMLVNPGGPGLSGLGSATLGRYLPRHAGDTYDWIGFDPRGVGSSIPALSCVPRYFHGNRPPYTPAQVVVQTWLARSKAYAEACQADAPALLLHMRTVDSARDMDTIRQALGAKKINYYGFSYGTYLGEVYATLFPSHVRRMVFDSTVDPRFVWDQSNLRQDVSIERATRIWFRWLARHHDVYHLGTTQAAVRRLFYARERALRSRPADGIVGPAEWVDAFSLASYSQYFWTQLADALSMWVHQHDAQELIGIYRLADGPGKDNFYAVYSAVECTDSQWAASWHTWQKDNRRTHRTAPFVTWANAWYHAPCLYWPVAAGEPSEVYGGQVKALLIDETLDAWTPYLGSLEVRRRFPDSSLVAERGGTSHAGTLSGNSCVDSRIAAFLATGTLPARTPGNHADAYCQPLPRPILLAHSGFATPPLARGRQ